MAHWNVTDIGTNSFTAWVYSLQNNFTSDNYVRIVWTTKDYGASSATIGNIFRQELSGIAATYFHTTFYDLSPGTTYKLYCYAQVSDRADLTPYHLIKSSKTDKAYNIFTTLEEQRTMTAPNEPSLDSNRVETTSNRPAARIKLSGMTDENANFIWQVKDTVTGTTSEFEFDDVSGGSDSERAVSFLTYIPEAKFCRKYEMRLGSIDKNDSSNRAWSDWSTFTTQPTNILLRYPVFVGRFCNRARIRFNAPSDEYSYYQVEIAESGTGNKTISTINKSDVTQGALFEFNLSRTGIYTITVSVAYVTGTNAVLYAVDENGNRATKSATVNYLRPDYFSWTVTPQTGVATVNVPSDDWNRLCQNVNAVVADFLGRGRSPYTESKDEIFLPNDSTLYGNLAGKSIYYVLNFTESQSNVGAKIDTDKTLYAWRYNALNYILCCVNNSDSETDVTNSDYAEHFAEGEPVYARYLTALSDKVNGV